MLLREDRLVLVGEQHVAAAREERLQRLARALVLRDDVVVQLLEVLDRPARGTCRSSAARRRRP